MLPISSCPIEILLATYNGERTVAEQIESILGQSSTDWHLLVHDDGSNDSTVKIVKCYESKHPDRITFLDDEVRVGSAKGNFEYLMKRSTAPYVMFCDQDDVWFPEKVEKTFAFMKLLEQEAGEIPLLIHTDVKLVDSGLNVLSESMFRSHGISGSADLNELLVRNNVTGCTVMVNRQALDVSLPMPREAPMHDWWVALSVLSNNGRIEWMDSPTMYYRQHGGNTVGVVKMDWKRRFSEVWRVREVLMDWRGVHAQAKIIKPISMMSFVWLKIRVMMRKTFGRKMGRTAGE
jgi:glycosyltransferase involved in cell wall biosynthesis